MAEGSPDRDTVAVEEAAHDVYRALTEGNDPLMVPFRTMKDVFMWAASLGYKDSQRRELTGKRVTIFRWSVFTPQTDIPLIKAMAIGEEQDVTVLQSQDRMLTIVEEYANAGLQQLKQHLLNQSRQPLWNLVDLTNI